MSARATKTAQLHRMVMDSGTCPSGVKAKALLEREGYHVEDIHLKTRAEVDAFKQEQGVKTTPQVFIDGTRIGGFDDLSAHFGAPQNAADAQTYQPVIALFAVAGLLAIAITWIARDAIFVGQTILWFIAIAMVLLGLQKLQDIDKFATMFLTYDLLAMRWPGYARLYPFIETGAGLLMLMGVLTALAAPVTLVAAGIGAYSVIKAVYIDKRKLQCACLGDSRVPLGHISLLENAMMVGMALYMLV